MRPFRPAAWLRLAALLAAVVAPSAAVAAPGDLDPTFGTGGRVVEFFGGSYETGYDGLLLPDGRMVVVGTSYNSG